MQAKDELLAMLAPYRVQIVDRYELLPFLALRVDAAALAALGASPDVAEVEPDTLSFPTLAESTPLIGAPAVWSQGFTGAGQTVAVLDTGVDASHPFLSGKVVAQACFSDANLLGLGTSLCPQQLASAIGAGAGLSCLLDGCEHGTHVAGIIAGRGTSFSGVAPDANLIAVQVFTEFTSGCGTQPSPCIAAYMSDQLAALEYIYSLRSSYAIAAVNMSLGGGSSSGPCDSDARKTAIDMLRASAIATVIAAGNAGNSNTLAYPPCISSAISVGATTDGGPSAAPADRIASFSNSSSYLSLLAPGQAITSSVPGGGFAELSGTSMATPHVAGAWAVLKEAAPSASVDRVAAALKATGVPILDTRNNVAKLRIQLDAALNTILGRPSITIDDLATAEGSAGAHTVALPVHLSAASTQEVRVAYSTHDGSARAASDFSAASGTLVFAPGTVVQTLSLQLSGDTLYEPDESFSVALSAPTNAVVADAEGRVTLLNDDPAPQLTLDALQVHEDATGAIIVGCTLNLAASSGETTTVDYQLTAGRGVYTGTVQLAPGETTSSITILVNRGDLSVGANTIQMTLIGVTNATITQRNADTTFVLVPRQGWATFLPLVQG